MFISHKYKVIFVHIQRTGGNSVHRIFQDHDPALVEKVDINPTKNRTRHCFLSDIKTAIPPEIYNNYTKICIVRNPYDRMVSWFARFQNGVKNDEAVLKGSEENHISLATKSNFYSEGYKLLNKSWVPFRDNLLDYWTKLFNKLAKLNLTKNNDAELLCNQTGISLMMEVNKNATCFEDFVFLPANYKNGVFSKLFDNQLDYLSVKGEVQIDRVLKFETLAEDFLAFSREINFPGNLPHFNKSKSRKNYLNFYSDKTKEIIFQRFKKDFNFFNYDK
jgi:hypothetical protein